MLRHPTFSPLPTNDPWKRLAAKIIERAVLDVFNSTTHRTPAAEFLTDTCVRNWSDAWELSLPWRKIIQLAQPLSTHSRGHYAQNSH